MPDSETSGGSSAHVERVVLQVEAPKQALQGEDNGLAYTLNRLRAINVWLGTVSRGYDDLVRKMQRAGALQSAFSRGFAPPTAAPSQPASRTARSGSSMRGPLGEYAARKEMEATLQSGSGTHRVKLEIPASAIDAVLSQTGGRVKLAIDASQIDAKLVGQVQLRVEGAGSKSAAAGSGGGGSGGSGGSAPAGAAPSPGGRVLSTTREGSPHGQKLREVVALDEFNRTLQKTLFGEEQNIVTTEERPELGARNRAMSAVANSKADIARQLEKELRPGDVVGNLQAQARAYESLAQSIHRAAEAHQAGLNALDKARFAQMGNEAQLKAAGIGRRAQEAEAKAAAKAERDQLADRLQAGRNRIHEEFNQALAASGGRKSAVAAANVQKQSALAELHQDLSHTAPSGVRGKFEERALAHAAKAWLAQHSFEAKQGAEAKSSLKERIAEAEAAIAKDYGKSLTGAGDDRVAIKRARIERDSRRAMLYGQLSKSTTGPQSHEFMKQAVSSWEKAVTANAALNREMKHLADATNRVGKNLLQNVQHVTAWATGVGILYGSLRLLRHGVGTIIELEYQQARLTQVFRHGRDQVRGMVDEILLLAAANGRTSQEAMEAAIAWSRLGLNRVQVVEAVRVSLMAANVAEITAAEATEHLSALMAVYELRASQLNGVLGMLNATSNTYNVTNKDLLDGLSRTASAAKQAGIPLAELIGLVGAGVGRTGQTGANIGNAIKSITGSISSEDKQRLLREQFRFEVTEGSGERLKDMSTILSELFVAYQRMSAAERQTMIFNVAGKNQASRMTALLDNYIRAQVLAINAQLNLNSAEQENALIKGTLKSQLQGLITEWERFVKMQAEGGKLGDMKIPVLAPEGLGPAQALNEITKSFKNLLALLNTSGGSVAATGFLTLLTALTAKLLVTSVVMDRVGRDGGVLKNTWQALKDAMGGMKKALAESLRYMPQFVQSWAGIKRGADGAVVSMNTARVAIAATAVALGEFLLVAAVIWALTHAWNVFAEEVGLSSDTAEKAMNQFAERSEQAKASAEAAATQIKLLKTVRDALASSASPDARQAMLGPLLEGIYAPEGTDTPEQETTKARHRKAKLEELALINRIQDAQERNAKFGAVFIELEAQAIERRVRKRREEFQLMKQAQNVARAELRRLEKSPFASKESIRKQRDRIEELQNQKVKLVLDTTQESQDDLEAFKQSSTRHATFLETQKQVLEAIRDIYSQLPGDTYLDKLNKEVLAHQTSLNMLKAQLDIVNRLRRQAGMSEMNPDEASAHIQGEYERLAEARSQAGKELFQQTGAVRYKFWFGDPDVVMAPKANPETTPKATYLQTDEDLAELEKDLPFIHGGSETVRVSFREAQQRVAEFRAKLEKIRAEEAELRRKESQVNVTRSSPNLKALDAQASDLEKQRKEVEAKLGALQSPAARAAAELQDRHAVSIRLAKADFESYAVGENAGEQFAAQTQASQMAVANAERRAATLSTVPAELRTQEQQRELQDAQVQALTHRVQLTEQLVKGEELLKQLHKEELNLMIQKNREYQRSLLTAGPGELLRKLAVNQMTRGRELHAGQFFAFTTEARQDILSMPEFDHDVREKRRAQDALRRAGAGQRNNVEIENQYVRGATERRRLMELLAPQQVTTLNENALLAANSLTQVANAANRVIAAFNDLAGRLPGVVPPTTQQPSLTRTPVLTPQARR